MSDGVLDPRLREALTLLRRALGTSAPAPGPWHAVPEPTPDDPWLVSATDLLTPWSPLVLDEDAVGAPRTRPSGGPRDDPRTHWDLYFGDVEGAVDGPPEPPPPAARPERDRADTAEVPAGSPGKTARFGAEPRWSGALDEPLAEDDADAAVACLYDFAHALGQGDVGAAMACVAEDFQTIEGDRAIDRRTLRHQIERLIDERRGCALDAGLAAVPEPIAFPGGLIVIPTTIYLDARPPDGLPTTTPIQRLAVLCREAGTWRIAGLAHHPDLAGLPAAEAHGH